MNDGKFHIVDVDGRLIPVEWPHYPPTTKSKPQDGMLGSISGALKFQPSGKCSITQIVVSLNGIGIVYNFSIPINLLPGESLELKLNATA